MKILIIGSKGFIGSHCVTYFSEQHTVYECDVVVDYTNKQYTQIDVTNTDYHSVFEQQEYDVCINCSGAASVPDSIKYPQRDFMLNTVNVFKQLDAIKKHNPDCKYINLSSAAVYGNPEFLPISETHPLNPISPYGVHKKMAEAVCESFYKNYGLQTCSLRIFSAYGEGLKKQLFWDLHKKVKSNNDIFLYGSGSESRDFIHILDLVKVIDLVIENCKFKSDCINVANGKELTIKKVAEVFYEIYQPNVTIHFEGQTRLGDPVNWEADISKISQYGYVNKIDLKTGLSKYVQWLKEKG
jgi:UDP-glucose 4-epimerase